VPSIQHKKYGVISSICVIIHAGGKAVGVLETDSTTKRKFADSEANLMQTVATLIGTVIERQQAEALLAQEQALVEEYAARLETSNKDLSQFASIASHDLQAPLRKVMLFSDFLYKTESDRLSDEGKQYIHCMQSSVNKMQTLISDLLSLSRVDQVGKNFGQIHLKEIVSQVQDDLQLNIKEAGASITVESSCRFEADEHQMVQLLTNLIGNAIKYRPDGVPPKVNIACKQMNSQFVELTISDNGIGIKPEHQGKIFEIFQRLHPGDKFSGTGIGLAIVKRIVDRHSGSIAVDSKPDEGSCFIIRLPVKQANQ
jgi:signal transduction histidine kinase